MGRVIKFRAYPTHDKAPFMVYWDLDEGDNRWPDNDGSYEGWEVMQFTGLTDKNGLDVLEGDVLSGVSDKWLEGEQRQFIASVEWDDEDTGFYYSTNISNSPYLKTYFAENIEVIGNVYEDSNLIEGYV